MTRQPYVTAEDQLDALALIEAVNNSDQDGERAILRHYIDDGDVAGLVTGLTTIALILAGVGVAQNAWPTVTDALSLTRLGIYDTTEDEQ